MSDLIESAESLNELNKGLLSQQAFFRDTIISQMKASSLTNSIMDLRQYIGAEDQIGQILKAIEQTIKQIEVFQTDIWSSGSISQVFKYLNLKSICERVVKIMLGEMDGDLYKNEVSSQYLEQMLNRLEHFLIRVIKQTQKHLIIIEGDMNAEKCKSVLSTLSRNSTENTIIQFYSDSIDINTCSKILDKHKELPTVYILGNVSEKESVIDSLYLYLKENPSIQASVIIQGDKQSYTKLDQQSIFFNQHFSFNQQKISIIAQMVTKSTHSLHFIPYSQIGYFQKYFDFFQEYSDMTKLDLELKLAVKLKNIQEQIDMNQINVSKKFQTLRYFIDQISSLSMNGDPQQTSITILSSFLIVQNSFYQLMMTQDEKEFNTWKNLFKLIVLSFMIYDDSKYSDLKFSQPMIYSGITISEEDLTLLYSLKDLTTVAFTCFYSKKEIAEEGFQKNKDTSKVNLFVRSSAFQNSKKDQQYKWITSKEGRLCCICLPFKHYLVSSIINLHNHHILNIL